MQGQGLFLTLAKGHLHMKIKTRFHKDHWFIFTKFCMLALRFFEMKIYECNAGRKTKMAAMPVYGKIR